MEIHNIHKSIKNMMQEIPPIEKNKNKETIEKKIEILHKYLESAIDQDIINCLERNREKAIELGRGNHAVVYTIEDEVLGSICVKEMIQNPEIVANDPGDEFDIQDNLNQKGIKTPYVVAQVFDKELKKQYILMERIFGFSVRDTIEGNLPLPDNFDLDIFIKKLEKTISSIHENAVLHRDLHLGNVMIDKDGEPVVIDFGMSSHGSPNMEKAYEKEISKKNSRGLYEFATDKGMDDKKQIFAIKSKLGNYIQEGK